MTDFDLIYGLFLSKMGEMNGHADDDPAVQEFMKRFNIKKSSAPLVLMWVAFNLGVEAGFDISDAMQRASAKERQQHEA